MCIRDSHPIEISPLTKKKPGHPEQVERFELYIYAREMCNAYSELNDPIDQRERFKAQEAALAAGDDEANTTDEDFLNALEILGAWSGYALPVNQSRAFAGAFTGPMTMHGRG